MPSAAWAEVCDKARPGWDGETVGMVGEAANLFLSPAGLALLLLSLIALRFRHQWIGLAAVILWTVFITAVTMADPTALRPQAMAEGCVGPPTLFIVAVAAICVGIVLYTKPRTSGADGSES
ncbi:MAG: hypothetical protein AAGF36_07965 [Pseudomonadota bacterium]